MLYSKINRQWDENYVSAPMGLLGGGKGPLYLRAPRTPKPLAPGDIILLCQAYCLDDCDLWEVLEYILEFDRVFLTIQYKENEKLLKRHYG